MKPFLAELSVVIASFLLFHTLDEEFIANQNPFGKNIS